MENQDNGAFSDAPPRTYKLCLYIAGGAPNSVRAMANLEALRQEYGSIRFEIEVVDMLAEPERVLLDQILVTPTLVKHWPPPIVYIVGDLSDRHRLIHGLGLDPKEDSSRRPLA